jgi:DNA-binding response OmpR family regulator
MGEVSRRWLAAGSQLRVLVTNDDTETAAPLVAQLNELGCNVRVLSNGPSALRQALAFCPDLVLLDLGLARLSGFDLARSIRREAGLENTKLIAVTAFRGEFYRHIAVEPVFHRYLRKPYDFEQLAEVIASVRRVDAFLGHAAE